MTIQLDKEIFYNKIQKRCTSDLLKKQRNRKLSRTQVLRLQRKQEVHGRGRLIQGGQVRGHPVDKFGLTTMKNLTGSRIRTLLMTSLFLQTPK